MTEVVFIGVTKECQSREIRCGDTYARAAEIMLEAISEWARERGSRFIFSDIVTGPRDVAVRNEASIKFHTKQGFRMLGAGHLSQRSPVRDGVTLELTRFYKSLTPGFGLEKC
jgi:hypothetical protein